MDTAYRAIAIVGMGSVMPDAPNVAAFWENVKQGRSSITEVPPERWDPELYYDPDPKAPDKTYSKIGSWVRQYEWDPMKWHMPVPPRVAAAMDDAQKWAIACTRAALQDYGYPERPLDAERTGVILGSAIAGEHQYFTVLRLYFPEYERELAAAASFAALPAAVREQITRELHQRVGRHFPEITEDTMPGELANCIAGRIANLFNFHGPNFVCDAACASAMAGITAAVEGLVEHDFDVAITGGIDRNMGPSTYVKFCKIGALSATGTRPYAEGADGFVMGEGAAIFIMKRLADAERDGDNIYAVLRGIGASSDGKGKGITAPNPVGPKLAIERGWKNAGLSPATVTMIEGHGTSTAVGDAVELQCMIDVLKGFDLPVGAVALGSVKSNIGHLKGAAGAAGLLKTILALRDKVLPPSINCKKLNPGVDFAHAPLYVNTELRPWTVPDGSVRRAGASAFGFGGTNFHCVLEEYIPRHITGGDGKRTVAVPVELAGSGGGSGFQAHGSAAKAPLRGALVVGAESEAALVERLRAIYKEAQSGRAPARSAPAESDLRAPERIAIDYADAADLAEKLSGALNGLQLNQPGMWKALRAKGIFRGHGPAPKVAFLYTGQGSQYVNMMASLRAMEPIVAETFAEADRIMTPLLGKPLSDFIFVDKTNEAALAQAEEALRQTAITQPAVISTDLALTRLLSAYGIEPDMTMGHSLGEYGALVAAGGLSFADALEAVSARGREMTRVSMDDNGRMAAVFAPLEEIERVLKSVDGYVVVANINSPGQAVIGGASKAVEQAMQVFEKAGYRVAALPVSHAFHTRIVAAASEPLRQFLTRIHLQPPRVPVIANVTGEFYPTGADVVPRVIDILAQQVAAPVQFVKGVHTLYDAGARVFVETGPKRALQGLVEDVLHDKNDVISLFSNHPKDDVAAFNQALCGLYAAGLGKGVAQAAVVEKTTIAAAEAAPVLPAPATAVAATLTQDQYTQLGRLFAEMLERGSHIVRGREALATMPPVVITGAALGLPGTDHVFDDQNLGRILRGEQFIGAIPMPLREAMLDKNITRLVKSDAGGPTFESIRDLADVLKLAGRGGTFNLEQEFGVPGERIAALDRVTALAIAAGIDALRDAGIPLVMRYKTTTKGTQLPDRWMLPESMRDDTGVVFASAFPGLNAFEDEMSRYYADRGRREQMALLQSLRARLLEAKADAVLVRDVDGRIAELRAVLDKEPYLFDRRFLFRVLSMGHSQFAEYIGARGPNTQVNAACASTTQAIGLAEDWIRTGRCRRVIVVSADDVTSDQMMEWIGAGFLATGAAATDDSVEDAAIPFDRRRHGMIVGMGAAALVVEGAEAARERGIRPICEVLGATTANSAFHGTRLDVKHISQVMEDLVAQVEARCGLSRRDIAPHTVFVSHETYTPARGGSAAAEINALRHVFGDTADRVVITNTKGFTGHAMGAGIEDVLAVKALETGCVPPVPNFKEVDPELGSLNLSQGGAYPVQYALRLAAGFGSQISLTLLRWVEPKDGAHRPADALGYNYRIDDPVAWNAWTSRIAGHPAAELEVVQRTLRVRDTNVPARVAEPKAQVQPVVSPAPPLAVPPPAPVTMRPAPPAEAKPPVMVPAPRPQPMPAMETVAPLKPVTPAAPVAVKVQVAAPIARDFDEDDIKQRVLSLVAEKTGYPVDMLDLELDLEADLGIDTVKQAEIFAAIRETYGIPRDDQLKLRDFPTLAHVIRFVVERRPKITVVVEPVPATTIRIPLPTPAVATRPESERHAAPPPATPPPMAAESVQQRVLALVAEKTGYPKEMLDLDLDLEADLGIDTVKQAEMFAAIRQTYDIARDETLKLRDFPTLAHVIRFVFDKRPDLAGTPRPAATTTAAEVTAAPVAPPVTPATSAATTPEVDVQAAVLAIVAEKTGYPKEMLDLDLDLEADLGIDTVKQAEMFAAVRAAFDIPRDETLKLRDFPTLAHVIRFAQERRAQAAGSPPAPPAADIATAQPPAPVPVPATPIAAQLTTLPSAPPSAVAASDEEIKTTVLAIVAEKTGYPKEMLDLDLDLEADLGIDTVKQAEMFAAVRTAFDIPRDETLKLRDFPTLAHVIRFAQERRTKAAAPAAEPAKPASKATVIPIRPPAANFEATNQIPRRVPVAVVRPPLAMCKPTGANLGPGARVVVMPDCNGAAEALATRLRSRNVEVLTLAPTLDADAVIEQLKRWVAAGPVQGVYWLPALDNEGDHYAMAPAVWHQAVGLRLKLLYTTMRALYAQISAPGTFLVCATRLGGQHGYDAAGAVAPLGGAVVGFAKSYKRERSDCLVKAVDFAAEDKAAEVADLLLEETLHDPGAVEIGYKNGLRWTVGLQEQPAADGQPGMTLDRDSVFLITGAAGSIVSAITADLAAACGGTFYLLDIVPEPDAGNSDLKRFTSDKEGLKRELFARIQARGERATPVLVEKELAALERAQAALSAIQAVRAAGGTPHYISTNLTDAGAVAKVIERVRQQSGHIDVLLHAAGMERSHFLPDKEPREFDLVFDVKVDGWFNLLHAIGDMPLSATVVFSSIAGRFGNAGQTDYASANDLLCKITSNFRSTRPATRAIAIDWTAWGGIGMATRGSIPKMMDVAGIDMLPPEAGVPLIRRELTTGGTRGEVVVGQRLGVMINECDETGGLNRDIAVQPTPARGPMLGKVVTFGVHRPLTIETTLDPKAQPFLYDHQIEGTPVLPGVMGIEAFAEAAACLLPDWQIAAVENVHFLTPFKFYRGEPRTVTTEVVLRASTDGMLAAECRLIGHRLLPNQREPQQIVHFTGRVQLARMLPTAPVIAPPDPSGWRVVEAPDVYRLYFHGPAYQVIERAWWDGTSMVGEFAKSMPANHQPPDRPLLMAPRLIELCFQTAGLWEMAAQQRLGLPQYVGHVCVLRRPELAQGPLYAVVTPNVREGIFTAQVVDGEGDQFVHMTGYRTVALPNPINNDLLKPLQAVMTEKCDVLAV